MIRKDCSREYRREFLHALRNGESKSNAAYKAMQATQKLFQARAAADRMSEFDQREKWGDILERIIEWEETFIVTPIDVSKIPPKADMPRAELDEMNKQAG